MAVGRDLISGELRKKKCLYVTYLLPYLPAQVEMKQHVVFHWLLEKLLVGCLGYTIP